MIWPKIRANFTNTLELRQNCIQSQLSNSQQIVVLYGSQQVQETTLVQYTLTGWPGRTLALNAAELRLLN